MLTVFGIKNCNSMKKAFDWLNARQIAYNFHDYKKSGIDAAQLGKWAAQVGWQKLLNQQGTTWRGLSDAERADVDEQKAIALMQAKPSLIKRPVVETDHALLVGFDDAVYRETLGD